MKKELAPRPSNQTDRIYAPLPQACLVSWSLSKREKGFPFLWLTWNKEQCLRLQTVTVSDFILICGERGICRGTVCQPATDRLLGTVYLPTWLSCLFSFSFLFCSQAFFLFEIIIHHSFLANQRKQVMVVSDATSEQQVVSFTEFLRMNLMCPGKARDRNPPQPSSICKGIPQGVFSYRVSVSFPGIPLCLLKRQNRKTDVSVK